jgi:type I restriction enzyme M protein
LGKPILELERVIQATSNGQRTALQEQLCTLTTQKQTYEVAAKSARVGGDARCWPIFNLDLKNPNTKAGLEHPDPKDLITSMCSQKVEVMRPLVGIEALTAEV